MEGQADYNRFRTFRQTPLYTRTLGQHHHTNCTTFFLTTLFIAFLPHDEPRILRTTNHFSFLKPLCAPLLLI